MDNNALHSLQQAANEAAVNSLPSLRSFTRLFLTANCATTAIIPTQLGSQLVHHDGDNLVCAIQAISLETTKAYGLLTITQASFKDLAQQRIADLDFKAEAIELIFDITRHVCSATLPAIATALNAGTVNYEEPEVISLSVDINTLNLGHIAHWPQLVCIRINYELPEHPFSFNFILLLPKDLIEQV